MLVKERESISPKVMSLIKTGNLLLFRFNEPIGFAQVDEIFVPTLSRLGLWHLSHTEQILTPRLTVKIIALKQLLPLSRAVATLYKILCLQKDRNEKLQLPAELSKEELFKLSIELKVERTKFVTQNPFDCRLQNLIFQNMNPHLKPVNREVPKSVLVVPEIEQNALTAKEFDEIFGKIVEGKEIVLPEGLASRDDEQKVDEILSSFNK